MQLRSLRRGIASALAAVLVLGIIPGSVGAGGLPQAAQKVRVIVVARDDEAARAQVDRLLKRLGSQVKQSYGLVPGFVAEVPVQSLSSLAANPNVAAVSPDRREKLPPLPDLSQEKLSSLAPAAFSGPGSDPDHPELSPLALNITRAPDAWALGVTGAGVKVAVIDSGVEFDHPDLVGTAVADSLGNPLAADFTSTDLEDTFGHGTAVAGMIAAQGHEVYQVVDPAGLAAGLTPVYTRIRGLAPGAQLISAKVFDARVPYGGGWVSWIIGALDWSVANGAQIVNLSLGGGAVPEDGRDPLALAVTAARRNGVTVLVAAGNEGGGDGTVSSPATAAGALAVGASTAYRSFGEIGFLAARGKYAVDQLAGFSSIAPTSDGRVKPYILSPGAFDWSLAPMGGSLEGSGFQLFGGTSQATPVTAGAMALVYEAYRVRHGYWPRPEAAENILVGTADDLGYPALLQGNGRTNAYEAVRAGLGLGGVLVQSSEATPREMSAGSSRPFDVALLNVGLAPVEVSARATQLSFNDAATVLATGTADFNHTTIDVPVTVPAGYDLMDASLNWPSTDPGVFSPRMLIALYDPAGNFVNYQRPNVGGDWEFSHSVQARAARPTAGTWTVQLQLRNATSTTSLPYSLSVRFGRRADWSWVSVTTPLLHLSGRASGNLRYRIAVPAGTPAGTYVGEIDVQAGTHVQTLPVSVVVPIAFRAGVGNFSGNFSHGYQGGFNTGDWRYYNFRVPSRTGGLLATLAWPHENNAVEFYLVNPRGDVVNVKANDLDLIFTGTSEVKAHQIMVADPLAGDWQVVVHSFGFHGGAAPEPFSGAIRLDPPVAGVERLNVMAMAGGQTTKKVRLTNPGVVSESVFAIGQGAGLEVQNFAVSGTLSGVADAAGNVTGQVLFGGLPVNPDATVAMAYLNWDNPQVNLGLELTDPTWTSKDQAAGSNQFVIVSHRQPPAGQWSVVVSFASPATAGQSTHFNGGFVTVAPPLLAAVASPMITIPPGGSVDLPITFSADNLPGTTTGRLLITSVDGDILAAIPFTLTGY